MTQPKFNRFVVHHPLTFTLIWTTIWGLLAAIIITGLATLWWPAVPILAAMIFTALVVALRNL